MDLKDVAPSAYGHLMQRKVHNKPKIFLGDADSQYTSDEEKSGDNNLFRSTVTVAMTGKTDEISSIDA